MPTSGPEGKIRWLNPLLHYRGPLDQQNKVCRLDGHGYRAPLSSLPGCGLSVPTITGLPWRRGSCLRADTVVSSSLWWEGHSITSHISHLSVEEVGITLSHTSGSSLWRGWAPHNPTHRASARGGDGHRIIPHIGHQLVEGMGTALSHTSGISLWRGWAPCPSTHWAELPGSGRFLCNGWVAPTWFLTA
jgi:hypothetical protein